MKKFVIVFLGVLMLTGCGRNDSAQQFQGVTTTDKNYVKLGMKYLSDGNVPLAIQSFDTAIKNDPSNVENYLVLGQVYMKLNNPVRAADTFSAACKVDPNNGEAQYMKALTLSMTLKSREGDDFQLNYESALNAAKRSMDLFVINKDEERFQRSLVLIRNLTENIDQFKSDTAITKDLK